MKCVILAGGLGTRMRASAPDVPKSMILVAGKPFMAWQLAWLREQGVNDVVLSIGHQGEQLRDFVGDGASFGLRVSYVDEGDHLRGTAGALRFAMDSARLEERFFVLYGDSYLDVSIADVARMFEGLDGEALMTIFENHGEGEVSNVVFDGSLVTRYEKNCPNPPADMVFVDYGLLAFHRATIEERIARDDVADLSTLLSTLSTESKLAGFVATRRFFEIGSPAGLSSLEQYLRTDTTTQDDTS